MKSAFACLISLGFLGCVSGLSAQILYTFNEPGDLDLYFNATSQNTDMFSEEAGEGISGSRAIAASRSAAGTGARVEKLSFAGNQSSFTISYYFRHLESETTGSLPWILGIAPNSTYDVMISSTNEPDDHHIHFALASTGTLDTYRFRVGNMVAGTLTNTDSSETHTLVDGNWYKLTGDFTVTQQDEYDLTVRLENAFVDGTVGTLIESFDVSGLVNTAIVENPAVHAFFASGSSAARRGADVFDNFLSPVPEPSTALMLLLGATGLLLRRRRAQV